MAIPVNAQSLRIELTVQLFNFPVSNLVRAWASARSCCLRATPAGTSPPVSAIAPSYNGIMLISNIIQLCQNMNMSGANLCEHLDGNIRSVEVTFINLAKSPTSQEGICREAFACMLQHLQGKLRDYITVSMQFADMCVVIKDSLTLTLNSCCGLNRNLTRNCG